MRDYGKVFSTFWSSSTTAGMTDDAKMLSLYLMTCSHSTIAGVFRLPDGYVSEDLGWSIERVHEGFRELFSKGFANRCETTKWVWVIKHLEWNPPENPNQRKSVAKIATSIPRESCWKLDFMRVCGPLIGIEALPFENPYETLCEGFRNQKQKQKQEQKQEKEDRPARKRSDPVPTLGIPELIALGVDPGHARDWLAVRKAKAPLTLTAWAMLETEATKAGITAAEAVAFSAARSWIGFKAEWLKPDDRARGSPPAKMPAPDNFESRDYGTGGLL